MHRPEIKQSIVSKRRVFEHKEEDLSFTNLPKDDWPSVFCRFAMWILNHFGVKQKSKVWYEVPDYEVLETKVLNLETLRDFVREHLSKYKPDDERPPKYLITGDVDLFMGIQVQLPDMLGRYIPQEFGQPPKVEYHGLIVICEPSIKGTFIVPSFSELEKEIDLERKY